MRPEPKLLSIFLSMWMMTASPFELILRALVIYAALFVLFRLSGKKQLGEMSPFDLVLILIISEAVSASLSAEDSSVSAALISASTLIFLGYLMDRIAFYSKKAEKVLEGDPQFVISNGRIHQNILNKEKITQEELKETMRAHGFDRLDEIDYAVLETNGKISYVRKADASMNTSKNPRSDENSKQLPTEPQDPKTYGNEPPVKDPKPARQPDHYEVAEDRSI